MSLCRELGGMTYYEMLSRMTSKEITMWMAYNQLDKEQIETAKMESEVKQSVRRA